MSRPAKSPHHRPEAHVSEDRPPLRPNPRTLTQRLLARAPALSDEDQDPTARALALALEKAERALEPFRAALPAEAYEMLVLELVGEALVDPTLASAFEELVPGASLQSGVRVRAGATEEEPGEESGGSRR